MSSSAKQRPLCERSINPTKDVNKGIEYAVVVSQVTQGANDHGTK
jgi:hypothetical protein